MMVRGMEYNLDRSALELERQMELVSLAVFCFVLPDEGFVGDAMIGEVTDQVSWVHHEGFRRRRFAF